jgi:hypothetical protein
METQDVGSFGHCVWQPDKHEKESIERYDKMTPEQKHAMYEAQRQSFLRSIVEWPKPKYKWVNGVKVYESYSDYCND